MLLEPLLPEPPMLGSFPPMTQERSMPSSRNICVSIEEVVVFPWVPQTQTASSYQLVIRPSMSALSQTVALPAFSASLEAISSGLSAMIAAV